MQCFKGQLSLFQKGPGYEGPQRHYVLAAWHPTCVSVAGPIGIFHFATQKTMRYKHDQ